MKRIQSEMKRVVVKGGMSIYDFDDLSFDEQEAYYEKNDILAHTGEISQYASGVPGTYAHLFWDGALRKKEA